MTGHNENTHRSNCLTRSLTAVAGLLLIMLGLTAIPGSASAPNKVPPSYTSIAAAPSGGFWIQVDNGHSGGETLAIDGAPKYESVPEPGSIAAIPGGNAYWVVTPTGFIYARGGAPELCGGYLGNCSGFDGNNDRITGAAASPNGEGFWAVDKARQVWTAGNVASYGDATNDDQTPSGIVATPSGLGYYIVMNDGGVHARGDAVFYGSTGGNRPGGHDVTGLALSYDLRRNVNGYWLVADDGGVFTFGDAPFLGSTGGNDGGSYVTNIVTRPNRRSYAWVHANGQVGLSMTVPKAVIESTAPVGGVWGLAGQSEESGATILRLPADGSASQQWDLWPTTDDGKIVQIINVHSGMCADVTADARGPYLIQLACKGENEGWDNQRFTLTIQTSGCAKSLPTCVDFSPVNSPAYRVVTGENSRLTLTSVGEKFWTLIAPP
jgi:ricin-type beta-trefoil lectin protein